MKQVNVGILGLGTVAQGVVETLTNNKREIERRTNSQININSVYVRSLERENPNHLPLTTDITTLLNAPDIDLVIELMGGTTTAYDAVQHALANKKHVITANKELIALHGNELLEIAQKNGVFLLFEAAVAGAIPVLKVIREGLAANKIDKVAGIINGTCNYILSDMSHNHQDFQTSLKEAQALGYAEADPTFDIKGVDAAHKLTILASLAFGIPLSFDKVVKEGIDEVTLSQINYAHQFGYTIKHLALAEKTEIGIRLRIYPTLIPHHHPIALLDGPMNGVLVHGNSSGPIFLSGAGAGSLATASAVCADIIDIINARIPEHHAPILGFKTDKIRRPNFVTPGSSKSDFFVIINNLSSENESMILNHIKKNEITLERFEWDEEKQTFLFVAKNITEIAIKNLLNDVIMDNGSLQSSFLRVESFK